MPFIQRPSPNCTERETPPTAIIIHDTAGHSLDDTLRQFEDDESHQSTHVVIDRTGEMYQCVDFDDMAWPTDGFSIGIELVGNIQSEPYTDAQIESLITLCSALCFEYHIPLNRVVEDCHVAPDHQVDSGADFPWFDFLNVVGARVCELAVKV